MRNIKEQILKNLPKEVISFLIIHRKLTEFLCYSTRFFEEKSIEYKRVEISIVLLDRSDALIQLCNYYKEYVKEGEKYWKDLYNLFRIKYKNKDTYDEAIIINVNLSVQVEEHKLFKLGKKYISFISPLSTAYTILQYDHDYTALELAIAMSRIVLRRQDKEVYETVKQVINYYKKEKK